MSTKPMLEEFLLQTQNDRRANRVKMHLIRTKIRKYQARLKELKQLERALERQHSKITLQIVIKELDELTNNNLNIEVNNT